MKKIFTLLLLTSFIGFAFSQTHLSEDFSGNQMPPAEWTIDGYPAQWDVSGTTNAGGDAPEAKFTYIQSTGTTRLISPSVDLTGQTSVTVKFNHFYDDYTGTGPIMGIGTRSNGGDWTVAWSQNPTTDLGPETKFIEINNADVGSADFQFCLYLEGNMYNLDYWYVDNIVLYTPMNLDAEMTSIATPSFLSGPTVVSGTVTNYGLTEITSLGINWQVDDGPIMETIIDGLSIASNATYDFICDGMIELPIGGYELNVWINEVNGGADDFEGNNLLSKAISVISNTVAKKPLLEEFTSATCAPCATFNTGFVPWTEQNDEEIVLVKYQMNWPGSGDIYYTEEGGVRRNFYGVSFVPDLYGDGSQVATNMAAVQSFFDASVQESAFMSVVGTHSLDGTVIDVTTNILPYANFDNATVYIVVFEYKTVENVASNGETEFHHVMMKMLPDASGTTTAFEDRATITINESFDMSSTNVEEIDDLGVAVIVQAADGYVYQAVYSMEDEVYATEARLDDAQMDGESVEGFESDTFEYDINLPSNTTEVPEITGIPMDENAIVIVEPTMELPGTTIVDVFGQDLLTHNRYEFNFTLGVGVNSLAGQQVKVYPNPVSDLLFIKNLPENTSVRVTDMSGRTVAVYNANELSSELQINTAEYENGVYTLFLTIDHQKVVKKFTVAK